MSKPWGAVTAQKPTQPEALALSIKGATDPPHQAIPRMENLLSSPGSQPGQYKFLFMNIERLHDLMGDDGGIYFEGPCHDCGVETRVGVTALEDGLHIEGGAVYEPIPKKIFVKCGGCYLKDKTLRNYQECEVYARVVGYMRPISQFNEAKQQEFKDRVNYKIGGQHE